MLVICNGAARSGSNWIYNIAVQAIPAEPLADEWRRTGWGQASIEPGRLREYLAVRDRPVTVVKMHLRPTEAERDELLAGGRVIVLNVARDIRGAVNAHYHARVRSLSEAPDVQTWWEAEGRDFAARLRAYHTLWNVEHPAYHRFYFEELLQHFPSEIERARPVLERAGAVIDVEALDQDTGLEALVEDAAPGARELRLGQAEDWRNHLPHPVAREAIEIAGPYAFLASGN